jgi:hypothetical protein
MERARGFAHRLAIAVALAAGLTALAAGEAGATTVFSENFDTLPVAPGNWVNVNNSAPVGLGWFQGNAGAFAAQQGAADSYAAANFNSAGFGGNVSNWLMTPTLSLDNGQVFSFYTRTETPAAFADRLQVRLSGNGSSTDVGTTESSVGDFSTLLLDINPSEAPAGYPDNWTLYSITLTGLSGPVSGRLAFRYLVTDTSVSGDYIGLDTVALSDAVAQTPLPPALPLFASGLGLLGLVARQRKRQAAVSPASA